MDKREMRKMIRARKALVTPEQRIAEARAAFAAIEQTEQFAHAKNILLYHSLPDELPTHETIARWSKLKSLFLPRVNGNDLDIVPFSQDMSSDNTFGIMEPQGEVVDPDIIDLIIVPAVALDLQGNRLGRGKGYYDRLLATTSAFTIGVAMETQLVEAVPTEVHDHPLNAVFTSTQYHIITP